MLRINQSYFPVTAFFCPFRVPWTLSRPVTIFPLPLRLPRRFCDGGKKRLPSQPIPPPYSTLWPPIRDLMPPLQS
ncbi:hypothetical protein LZ30DRAFT_741856 [Colletotrichum cereale]|nr:hypothetical protein LZ30DRAFT_741856 [Colletotrichum cereale]